METLFQPLSRELWKQINEEVKSYRLEGRERPTVAAVIYHARSHKYLLITSTRGGYFNPGLVKGGVEEREDAQIALLREIRQELRIPKRAIRVREYGGSYSVPSKHEKEGRTIKRYFVFLVAYKGPHKLNINGELSGYYWCSAEEVYEVLQVLQHPRAKKYEVLMQIFSSLLSFAVKAKRTVHARGR